MSESASNKAGELEAFAVEAIAPRLKRMLSHVDGVLEGQNIEPVHQMRVWSRRTRAALDIFAPCFSNKHFETLAREVKQVTRALGEARDLDVMIERVEALAADLPEEQRGALEQYATELKGRRQYAQTAVKKALARLDDHDLEAEMARAAGRKDLS